MVENIRTEIDNWMLREEGKAWRCALSSRRCGCALFSCCLPPGEMSTTILRWVCDTRLQIEQAATRTSSLRVAGLAEVRATVTVLKELRSTKGYTPSGQRPRGSFYSCFMEATVEMLS